MKSIGKKILSTLILSVLIWQMILPSVISSKVNATNSYVVSSVKKWYVGDGSARRWIR